MTAITPTDFCFGSCLTTEQCTQAITSALQAKDATITIMAIGAFLAITLLLALIVLMGKKKKKSGSASESESDN